MAFSPVRTLPCTTIPPPTPVPRITPNTTAAPAAAPSVASESAKQLAPPAWVRVRFAEPGPSAYYWSYSHSPVVPAITLPALQNALEQFDAGRQAVLDAQIV